MNFTNNQFFINSKIWGGLRLLPIFFLCFSCTQKSDTLFQSPKAADCGILFVNTVSSEQQHNFIDYSYAYNGGGVGAADLNNDGLPELVFTGNQVPSALYQNLGNAQFNDISIVSGFKTDGWCTGVTFADINADGLLDIYVCRSGNYLPEVRTNLCFINKGNLQFEEKAAAMGLADSGWSTQAAFFDYDRDGDLDCYIINASNTDRYPNRIKKDRKLDGSDPASDHFYQNENGHFTDITQQAGLGDDAWGLGLSIADINGDHWPDMYVANDFLANDVVLINQQNGQFRNCSDSLLAHTSHFSMGCDASDYNNDGYIDFMVADMMPSTNLQRKKMTGVLSAQAYQMTLDAGYAPQYMRNTLQLNMGNRFAEIGQMAGVYATDWTWSPLFADFDLDGKQDLAMTTGYLHDIIDMDFILQNNELGRTGMNMQDIDKVIKERSVKQPPYASAIRFFKQESTYQFTDQTNEWHTATLGFHNGSTVADLDGDGDLDLVSNNINQAPTILLNTTKNNPDIPQKNVLAIALQSGQSIGAEVRVFTGDIVQSRYLSYTHGYQSAGDGILYFGLNDVPKADKIEITWPDGTFQVLENIPASVRYNIVKSDAKQPQTPSTTPSVWPQYAETEWKHQETPYNDFDIEPLLPHQFSKEGPGVALGDINGDGLEDVFVSGAKDQNGCFLIQQPNGNYREQPLVTEGPKPEEDVAAALVDVDNDRDLDVVVISGGIELEPNALRYSPRLYLNNGKGQFVPTTGYLPPSNQPGSCVSACDYDQDGDQDLLIGGRRTALKYGIPGNTMLLQNDGTGHFKDVSEAIAPGLKNIGMVTDVLWSDWNGDGKMDILLGGEWMALTVFFQENGRFTAQTIPNTAGFWYCLTAADLDKDGDMDFVAGNMGQNNKYGIGYQTPLHLYAKDFDGNGYFDPVVGYFVQNQLVPVHGRDELMLQLPKLRKQYNSYRSYASANLEQIFSEKDRKGAHVLKIEENRSATFLNDGKGHFSIVFLPDAMQTAPVQSLLIEDTDHNGTLNILAVGNDYTWESGSGRMDASQGWFLEQKSDYSFAPMASQINIKGDCRAIKAIKNPKFKYLVAVNDSKIRFIR